MKSVKLFLLGTVISLAVSPVFGESLPIGEYPSYQNGVVTIPCIDTPDQPCMVQDAKLQYTEDGDWRLTDLKIAGSSPFEVPVVAGVEPIITDTFPIQVFLKVSGYLYPANIVMGRIPERRKDNRFEVFIYAYAEPNAPGSSVPVKSYGFEKIIPLSVYGLSAGIYEYSLSGGCDYSHGSTCIPKTFTGTFALIRDNKF